MNKGFVIVAQNTTEIDYVKCAEMLARSIKQCMPAASVALISDDITTSKYFDYVIKLPYGDLAPNSNWKLVNDWQVYEASPYEYTIKLEADMYIPSSIDYWWEALASKDVVVSTTIRNYSNEISGSTFYRKFTNNNQLPNVYNAITYFKKSDFAKDFFLTVRDVFENWDAYKAILQCNIDEIVTTDWAYAIACHIHSVEDTTMPIFTDMSMIHMKQHINNLMTEDWTSELVYEILPNCLRINTRPQLYPFHYHIKKFASIIEHGYKNRI